MHTILVLKTCIIAQHIWSKPKLQCTHQHRLNLPHSVTDSCSAQHTDDTHHMHVEMTMRGVCGLVERFFQVTH